MWLLEGTLRDVEVQGMTEIVINSTWTAWHNRYTYGHGHRGPTMTCRRTTNR
jgi:hypothetical protein